jgi:hypothetical protein
LFLVAPIRHPVGYLFISGPFLDEDSGGGFVNLNFGTVWHYVWNGGRVKFIYFEPVSFSALDSLPASIYTQHECLKHFITCSFSWRESRKMEVMQVLHMNKGDDENSYAKNSKVQVCIPFSFYLFLYLTICARIHVCSLP